MINTHTKKGKDAQESKKSVTHAMGLTIAYLNPVPGEALKSDF